LRTKFKEQDDDVKNRLSILDEFNANLKSNLAVVQTNDHKVSQMDTKLNKFMASEVFTRTDQNYAKIIAELDATNLIIERKLVPGVDKLLAEIKLKCK
jgi:nitrate reductase NapAB chaperone NapD